MNLVELLLMAVALAMDAFAVSICGSMVLRPENRATGALRFGSWFGGFQFLMPVLGYFGSIYFVEYITSFDHWIAFFLLAYIGGNMIKEAGEEPEEAKESYTCKEMLVLAVATSIDALAVGISLACLNTNIWYASTIIGLVSFVIAGFGGLMGFKLGATFGQKANYFGGAVLLCIGIKILLEHLEIL